MDDKSTRCGTSGPTIQTCRCFRYVTPLVYLTENRGFNLVVLTQCRCVNHEVSKVVSSTWWVKRSHTILVRPLKPFKIKVLVCLEMSRTSHPIAGNHTSEDPKPQQRHNENLKFLQSETIFPSTERKLLSSDFPQTSTACPPDTTTVNIMVHVEHWWDTAERGGGTCLSFATQTSHGLARFRTLASALIGRRLSAWTRTEEKTSKPP